MNIDLKPAQIKVASLLAIGLTVTKAAELSDCSRQSVYRWLKDDDEFVAYINRLKNEQIESVRNLVQSSTGLAVRTILNLMKNSTSDAIKLAAAKELLSSSRVLDSLPRYFDDNVESLRSAKKLNALMELTFDEIN